MQWLVVGAGIAVGMAAMLGAMGYRGRQQVVGIDLGTTYSVVAIKSGKDIAVLPDFFTGKPLVPSVVTFHPNGSVLVGSSAVALRGELPLHTIFNSKRFIGRPFRDCQQDAAVHPFSTGANISDVADDSAAGFIIPRHDGQHQWVSPVEVGAAVVKHLKESISRHMGYTISKAVICVPAKFSWKERKATADAFAAAGIKVMRVLEEPTAAAVAYNLHKGSGSRHVLVYDIGGGTLDTSLLFMNGKAVSVLGVSGDDHLGGSDFDALVRDVLMAKLAGAPVVTEDTSSSLQHCDQAGLLILGEDVKISLSSVAVAEVRCKDEEGLVRHLAVTRAEFESAAEELFERCMAPVAKVLEDQMMTRDDVDDVVLVGGSSRIPRLRELLQAYMGKGKQLHTEIDPDVTVAFGAANILD